MAAHTAMTLHKVAVALGASRTQKENKGEKNRG